MKKKSLIFLSLLSVSVLLVPVFFTDPAGADEEDTAPYILFFSIQFRSDVQNEFQFKICGFALLFLVIDDFLYD